MLARRVERVVRLLGNFLDLPQNGVERMLQRAIHVVTLRGAELFEITADALASGGFAQFAVAAAKILDDLFARQDGFRHLIEHTVAPRL